MAEMNLTYYAGEDAYSDGDVENEILDFVRSGRSLDSLQPWECSYPFLYHLSDIRENILNWYPFRENCRILEIGAGCGAITGLLCRRAEKVVAVDLSKRRATINYERNRQYQNLEIYVGNLNDMHWEESFDYVILNGVLEYAVSFTEGTHPYETFLQRCAGFLKPAGRLLIAIENRLGMKYFAGAPEDHLQEYFAGLNGYSSTDRARTFSRRELSELLQRAGLTENQFYYPYPDYKFPMEIFTEEAFDSYGYGKAYFNINSPRFELFRETLVAAQMAKEGAGPVIANSFFVDAGKEQLQEDWKLVYAKMNSDRHAEYRIVTKIEQFISGGEKRVVKYAATRQAQAHIDRIFQKNQQSMGTMLQGIPMKQENKGTISYDFLQRETLDDQIQRAIQQEDFQKVIRILEELFAAAFVDAKETSYRGTGFIEAFGENGLRRENTETAAEESQGVTPESVQCICPANIDIICSNVFPDGPGQYAVIDCEWVFDFPIPVAFIQWRCLYEIYMRHVQLESRVPIRDMEAHFGISAEEEAVFRQWNFHFIREYAGIRRLEKFEIPQMQISLREEENKKNKGKFAHTTLYLDHGNGYNEQDKFSLNIPIRDGGFSIDFPLTAEKLDGLQALRWDPCEGMICEIRLKEAQLGQEGIRLEPCNADLCNGERAVFMNTDPQYRIFLPEQGMQTGKKGQDDLCIHLSGIMTFPDEVALLQQFRQQTLLQEQKLAQADEVRTGLEEAQKKTEQKNKQLRAELAHIKSTKGYRMLQKVNRTKDILTGKRS